jgi:hypothetical protein
MSTTPDDPARRTLLKTAAAGLAVSVTGSGAAASAAKADADRAPPPGKPGDFDFLAGEWKIRHRRLETPVDSTPVDNAPIDNRPSRDEWDEFEGEATCWTILGGVGSVEELRIPARNFSGMGLRLLDVDKRVWSDFWVNAKSGALTTPGQTGHFIDGAGIFSADDMDGDNPIKVRGVWDRITPTSCRWHQALSYDGGNTWRETWFMDWTRVDEARA